MSSENPYQHKVCLGDGTITCRTCLKRDAWHEGNKASTERFEAGCPRMHLDSIPMDATELCDQYGRRFKLDPAYRRNETNNGYAFDFDKYNGVRR